MKLSLWKLGMLLVLTVLLVYAAGCTKNNKDPDTDGDETAGNISVPEILSESESGVTCYGWIAESLLPSNTEIKEWYDEARDRETLTNALLYSKGEDGLWHCWLYIGTWKEGDTVAIGRARENEGCTVINHKPQNINAEAGSAGAIYFTVSVNGEPDFDFYVGGVSEGILRVHTDVSVAR